MDGQATSFLFGTQSDLTLVPFADLSDYPAQRMEPAQRQKLALQVLVGTHPVAELARRHQVSRAFLYRQADTATHALADAFDPAPRDDDVLFSLPVTKAWLRQLVLALVLIGHSPYRAVVELLRDLFDWKVSLGTVHNVVHGAVEAARAINRRCDLAGVRIGAHDEIFQAGRPVLVGVDTASTYCYLLSLEDHRDAETWGVRLLELVGQGFAPKATIADAGSGLRAGQALALPAVPCRGDIFHILHDLEQVAGYLENRAYSLLEACQKYEQQRSRQRQQRRRRGRRGRPIQASPSSTALRLRHARDEATPAVTLYDDVALLLGWLRHDVLAVAGPCVADRRALYDFVAAELKSRVPQCPHRLGPVCRELENQRDDLLAFARALDDDLEVLEEEFQVPSDLLRRLLGMQARHACDLRRWSEEATLRARLRGRFHQVQDAVAKLARGTVRASSLVENLNSRLRSYFFLRRHLGADYLALLQFFLNHRRLQRSAQSERVGKTPAELLTGRAHPHWLEMLGYTRFVRA
jgi:hypothetical protein